MTPILNLNKKTLPLAILLAGFLVGLVIARAHAAANDSSITLKKDPASGLFSLTIKDPDGIQEFSLTPPGRFPYSGGLSSCPRSFSIDNVAFNDPSDFKPVMSAYVIDCRNNTADLTIAPPENGLAKSTPVIKEAAPSPPQPSPKKEEPKEEKKGGPLSASDVKYPVLELGGCQSEKECRSYCDNSEHGKECFAFAKKYKLITEKEAERAEKQFFDVKKGPGGCNSGTSCEAYCNNVNHLDECIAFAEESGYYSGDKLAEAKKFQQLVKSGKQFPGGCKDRNTCELYCNDPNHMEECLSFAEETGFMPKEEIDQARKILPLMKKGETPGGCTSKEQCEKYCFEDSHADECVAFAEKAGLISAEDAVMVKKTGGKGPGGCRSKEQCEAYCENNSDECFKWAQDNGLVSSADLDRMKTGMAKFKEQLDKIPPEVAECLKDAAGEKNFNKLINGQPVFDRGLEGKMKACFNQLTSQVSKQLNTLPPEASQCIKDTIGEEGLRKLQSGEPGENVDFGSLEGCFQKLQSSFSGEAGGPGGPGGSGSFSGPGGCKSIDECTSYCQTNPDACKNFAPPGGSEQGGSSDKFRTGLDCSPKGTVASFVCAKNGRGASPELEVTYFNGCTAKEHGAEIIHEGVCTGHVPCADVADPVCGNDGNTWVSACYAEGQGGGVQYAGACKSSPSGFPGRYQGGPEPRQPQMNYGGPGGCRSEEECQAYCAANPDKCQGTPSSAGTRTETGIESQYQKSDPGAECAKYGGLWDGKTCQRPSVGAPSYPGTSPLPPPSGQTPQDYCSGFASVPSCSYVGSTDSQDYKYCKQCFPDK